MNRRNYLLKNVGLLTISNFSSKILVFFLVPLYTRILSTTDYGIYDLVISTVALLYPILTLNIADAVMRFSMDNSIPKEKIVGIGMKYVLFSVIAVGLILLVLSKAGIWQEWGAFIFLYYLSYVLNQFFIQYAKGLEKVLDMAVAGVLGTLSMIIFNVLFLLILRLGLSGFFVANILSQGIPVVYFFFRLKFWRYVKKRSTDKDFQKEMFSYCIPLIAVTLGWWINNSLDKYAVTFICGIAANGLLSVAYKIPSIINMLQSIFIQAWQVSAIKEYKEKNTVRFYGYTFSMVNMMMCVACAGLIFLTKLLAHVLYVKDFYVAWKYVPFLLISSVLNCASGLLGPILSARKDAKTMMWSSIAGAGINALANVVFIQLVGIQGATIATVLSSLAIYIIRRIGVGEDIVIEKYCYLSWGLLAAQAVVKILVGDWWIEIALVVIMLLVNWRLIAQINKEIKNKIKSIWH